MRARVSVCMCMCTCMCVHVYVYVCVYVCLRVYLAARPRMAPAVRSRESGSPSCSATTHLFTSSKMWFSTGEKDIHVGWKMGLSYAIELVLLAINYQFKELAFKETKYIPG